MEWELKRFDELTLDELYDSLRLRVNVFVVEQKCPYPELDGIDRSSLHLLGREGGRLLAYLRLFRRPGEENTAQLGRVVTSVRGKGYGAAFMDWALNTFRELGVRNIDVKVVYGNEAIRFYQKYGFRERSVILTLIS